MTEIKIEMNEIKAEMVEMIEIVSVTFSNNIPQSFFRIFPVFSQSFYPVIFSDCNDRKR